MKVTNDAGSPHVISQIGNKFDNAGGGSMKIKEF